MVRFLELLWAPFKIEKPAAGSTPVQIDPFEGGWAMQIGTGPRLVAHDIWNFAASFRLALETDALDEAQEVTALHGAVVTRDGEALLLIGPVGTGKTTLALDLLERGWKLSSDDVAPIDALGRVLSFRRPVGIKGNERWSDFLERWDPPSWVQEPTHFFQVPATVFPLGDDESYEPKAIVLPRYDVSARGGLQMLAPAQATLLAMQHVHRVDPPSLSLVTGLCGSVPVGRLTYQSSEEGIGYVGKVLSLAG